MAFMCQKLTAFSVRIVVSARLYLSLLFERSLHPIRGQGTLYMFPCCLYAAVSWLLLEKLHKLSVLVLVIGYVTEGVSVDCRLLS
jgi:hypothetical protein